MTLSTDSTSPILQVEHLSMKFGGLVAIGDLSFDARRGEITALIGPNGAGKTTVFNCITGFYKPTEGMIRFTGKAGGEFLLERMPDFQITAKAKVARTFQNIRLFSGMTVLENLLVAQHNKLMKASGYTILGLLGIGGYRQASAESVEKAKYWLEKAELVDRADDPAGDLPYGAQRRLEIARAMCTDPELLCLDEPAAGLNPKESLALNSLLNDIKTNTGTSILLIEHDMSVVMEISDHIVVLEYGRKISDGDPTSVRTDPRVIAAYLGVDDEEVEDVLTQVGDENVIEELDTGPDADHGPSASASMLAGPVSDTVVHGNGERVTVEKGASKAAQVKPAAKTKTVVTPKAAAAKVAQAKPVAVKAAPVTQPKASAVKAPVAKEAAPATKAKPVQATVKPAAAKPATVKTVAAKAAPKPAPKAEAPKAKVGKPAATAVKKPVAKAAAKPAASPAAKVISNRLAAPRGGRPDDLLAINGIGPVNLRKLNEHGIFHFDQIAAWKKADIQAAEAYLAFDGRIAREDWVGQAKALSKKAASDAAAKRGGRK
ncbi:ABC transporter [Mesorhizobium sp. Root157]|uniref:ATP-binding cassette domain-containing protein n=1 Tax=Mesorhizobium sp. Root157 TaxID=1736477 RepID=UPI0006F68856|nr:ATP-binding cassette domain-containing protein [Mesorhizobium sp. Root157]KQZ82853.1 ABC transporter [Mesorhizobium sp. Root157]